MSKYRGGMVGSVDNNPTGTAYTGKANGMWSLPSHIVSKSASLWAAGQTRPGTPSIGTASSVNSTSVSVAFIAPVSDGGSTITSYTVTSSGGQTATGTSSPIVVSGLNPATSYTFYVSATNAIGTSDNSNISNSVFTSTLDANYNNVSLLLNGDGYNGSTMFVDNSPAPKTITPNGNAQISTAQYKFGTSSMYFDGASSIRLSTTAGFDFSDNTNFTIEGWVYLSTINKINVFFSRWHGGGDYSIHWLSDNYLYFNYPTSSSATNSLKSSSTFAANTWYHIAIVRNGSSMLMFINGILSQTQTVSNFYNVGSNYPYVGEGNVGSEFMTGYIDDLRVTKGLARYTGSFTPPTTAFPTTYTDPYWSNTVLLLDGSTIDLSPTPKDVTWYGNAQISNTQSKYGTGSLYFDGTGDYLQFSADSSLQFGIGDFTIECWIYTSVKVNYQSVYICIAANDGAWLHTDINGYFIAGTNGNELISTNTQVCDNTWHHIALSRSGTDVRLFVDGVLKNTVTSTYNIQTTLGTTGTIGSYGTSRYFNGYIDDLRITKGVARYTANFTPPTSHPTTATAATVTSDSNYANVSLLLSGEGYNGSTSIVDTSPTPKTITVNGNAQISTAQKKFGTSCIAFDGTNGYLSLSNSTAYQLLNNSFTVEFWVYFSATWSTRGLVGIHNNSNDGWFLRTTASALRVFTAGGGSTDITVSFNQNQWYHIAFTSTGTTGRVYIGGVDLGYSINTTGTNNTGNNLQIGQTTTVGDYLQGYISDLRITKGVARYTANFTPPTASLPATANDSDPYRSNVSLLLRGDSFDKSMYGKMITRNADAQISSTQYKYGTASWAFDGTGDYLSLAANNDFNFGTGDFTVEMWINIAGLATQYPMLLSYTTPNQYISISKVDANNFKIAHNLISSSSYSESTTTYPIGTWHHLAVCRNGTTMKYFVNGVLAITIAESGTIGSASQVTIGYSNNYANNYYLNGYIDDLRITKGIARYTANFTPPTQLPTDSTDTYWYNTVLLLNGENTDQSVSQKQVTWYGNATVSNTQVKYGTGALYFDGSSYIKSVDTSDVAFGTGDFTIECWVYVNAQSLYQTFFSTRNTADNNIANSAFFGIKTGTLLPMFYTSSLILQSSVALVTNTWTHVAVSRNSGVLYIFVSGVQTGTVSFTTDLTGVTPTIGKTAFGSHPFTGYIDDLRVTKGVARYTATFTPPTLPSSLIDNSIDSNYSNVSLLLKGDTFDKSLYPKTITRNADAQISTTQKKYGSSAWYFDGTGDYLSVSTSNDFILGTGDFTIEMWIYAASASATYTLLSFGSEAAARYNIILVNGVLTTNLYGAASVSMGGSIAANTWTHIAVARVGAIVRGFVNGVMLSTTDSNSSTIGNGPLKVGSDASGGSVFNGYIDDLRITKGIARYDGSFTVPTATLPITDGNTTDAYRSSVSLLLKGDAFDKSQNAKQITRNGDAQISTTQYKYGTSSWYFDGAGDYLSIPNNVDFNFGTGDFTIEFWYRSNTNTENTHATFIACYQNTTGASSTASTWSVKYSGSTGYIEFAYYNGGWGDQVTTVGVSDQTWHHVAVTRSGTDLRIFKDGSVVKTVTAFNVPLTGAGHVCTIGFQGQDAGSYINGYMDDLRVTKGVARYTANFTPPTQLPTGTSDPYWSYTSLLLNGENLDQSPVQKNVTWTGATQISNTQTKWGTGALYFSGTSTGAQSTMLTIPTSPTLNISTGDFTIEMWFYATSLQNYSRLFNINSTWTTDSVCINWNSSTSNLVFSINNIANPLLSTTAPPSMNTWNHVAVTRSGSTFYLFLNGTLQQSATNSGAMYSTSTPYYTIGNGDVSVGGFSPFTGYIDDLRVTKGIARYTANFTPPGPLPTA